MRLSCLLLVLLTSLAANGDEVASRPEKKTVTETHVRIDVRERRAATKLLLGLARDVPVQTLQTRIGGEGQFFIRAEKEGEFCQLRGEVTGTDGEETRLKLTYRAGSEKNNTLEGDVTLRLDQSVPVGTIERTNPGAIIREAVTATLVRQEVEPTRVVAKDFIDAASCRVTTEALEQERPGDKPTWKTWTVQSAIDTDGCFWGSCRWDNVTVTSAGQAWNTGKGVMLSFRNSRDVESNRKVKEPNGTVRRGKDSSSVTSSIYATVGETHVINAVSEIDEMSGETRVIKRFRLLLTKDAIAPVKLEER